LHFQSLCCRSLTIFFPAIMIMGINRSRFLFYRCYRSLDLSWSWLYWFWLHIILIFLDFIGGNIFKFLFLQSFILFLKQLFYIFGHQPNFLKLFIRDFWVISKILIFIFNYFIKLNILRVIIRLGRYDIFDPIIFVHPQFQPALQQ